MQITFEGATVRELVAQMRDAVATFEDMRGPAGPSPEEAAPAEAPGTGGVGETPSVDDVAEALKAHMRKHGKDSAVAVLAKHGAKRASDVADDAKASVIAELGA